MMTVRLIAHTPEPEKVVAGYVLKAAREKYILNVYY